MTHFFSTIADRRRRGTYDAELELRDYAAAAISATTAETGIKFAARKQEAFKVCISAAAYSGYSAGTAQWTITVEVSNALGGSYNVVATLSPAVAAGAAIETEIVLGGDQVADIDPDCTHIRVQATKTGSPGNLTYGAWIVPV